MRYGRYLCLPSTQISRFFFWFFLIFFITTGNAQAQAAQAQAAQAQAAQAQALTQALVTLNARYRETDPSAGDHLLNQLLDLAAERQALLASLIAAAPGEVLKTALPARFGGGMPAAVQDFLEQEVELEGELEVFIVDAEDPAQSRYVYLLETLSGERFSLHFAGKAPELTSGTPVRASGLLLQGVDPEDIAQTHGAIVLESGETSLEVLECCNGDGTAADAATLELQHTFGEQRTVVFLVNFQDDPNNKPWTIDEIRSLVFGDVSDFFLENSYGQTWLDGDVFGWYTIPQDSTTCDGTGIVSYAEQAAGEAGVDLSSYERKVYLHTENACGSKGTAHVGTYPSKTWLNGEASLWLFAHELGHNLGLLHSGALNCGDTTLGSECNSISYGDSLDAIGIPRKVGHFNAFQKERLGWLNYGTSPPIDTVTTEGTYSLEPYETESADPKAIKVLQRTDPVTGQRTWYYMEYRQPIGFDSLIPDTGIVATDADNVFNGVAFHLGNESDRNSSFLLDMTPEPGYSFGDPALTLGQSYTDPQAGVAITTEWTDAFGATVSVSFADAACAGANPQVSVSPSESLWVQPGTLVTYTVSVTNKDSTACDSSPFDLLATVPSGWLASFDSASLTLAPGASGSTTFEVTSWVSEADGFYDVMVTAENASDPTHAASASVTYVVSGAVNQPPVASNDSATTGQGTAVSVAVLNNDWDPDGDALSVASVTQGANGAVVINADDTVTYTPNGGFSGTDSFDYSVSDGQGGSDAASVTITVNGPVNQPPVAVDDSATTDENVPVTIAVLANDGDPDGDPLSVTSIVQGANGFAAINADGTVTYAPMAGFTGTDGFGYSVSDGQGGSASAGVTVTVGIANQPPLAVDDSTATQQDTAVTISVLANDSDPDGDPLIVASVGQGAKGTVTVNADGTITYRPHRKSKGSDSFGYTIEDSAGNVASAMVSVMVKNAKAGGGKGRNK